MQNSNELPSQMYTTTHSQRSSMWWWKNVYHNYNGCLKKPEQNTKEHFSEIFRKSKSGNSNAKIKATICLALFVK